MNRNGFEELVSMVKPAACRGVAKINYGTRLKEGSNEAI